MKKRVYIEIGNICNLSCSFCPKLSRAPRQMTKGEFKRVMDEVSPLASEIYLHLMGEPLLHHELDDFLKIAKGYGIPVSITTNGTLLATRGDILLRYSEIIKKVSISLQSYEANDVQKSLSQYLDMCVGFAEVASASGIYVVFRLWNLDSEERQGENTKNGEILEYLKRRYPQEWERRYSGFRLEKNTFLECAEIFDWPSIGHRDTVCEGRCYGLVGQIAVLADGTVVPCCLDAEGEIWLGNIFESSLSEILNGERAVAMAEGLKHSRFIEPLCQGCTYARRFT